MQKVCLTEIELKKASDAILKDNVYICPDKLLSTYLNKYPQNTALLNVAIKVIMINHFYSTNIHLYRQKISVCEIAKIIVDLTNNYNWDVLLSNGNPKAVELFANACKSKYNINLFSFATKYCFCHNWHIYKRDDYSIFDNVVANALPLYQTKGLPITVHKIYTWKDKIDYVSFNQYINDILNAYNIHISNRRRLFDNFLWSNYR